MRFARNLHKECMSKTLYMGAFTVRDKDDCLRLLETQNQTLVDYVSEALKHDVLSRLPAAVMDGLPEAISRILNAPGAKNVEVLWQGDPRPCGIKLRTVRAAKARLILWARNTQATRLSIGLSLTAANGRHQRRLNYLSVRAAPPSKAALIQRQVVSLQRLRHHVEACLHDSIPMCEIQRLLARYHRVHKNRHFLPQHRFYTP